MSAVFCGRLAQCLRFGHALVIAGKTSEGAERFNIFLSNDAAISNLNNNNGLSIDFDFDTDLITLKQFSNNKWNNESSVHCEYSNFLNEFTIYIIIGHDKLHFSINEDTTFSYLFQVQKYSLNFLEIKGDLQYIHQMDQRQYYPYTWPPIQVVERRLHFSNDTPMQFQTGHVMVISAYLRGNNMGRFIIHLRNVWDNEKQELHLSVRFDTQVMVWTSKTIEEEEHYGFDEEEQSSYFPFSSFSQPFKLSIAFAKHGLKFAKDGDFLYTFIYRSADTLNSMGGLKIFGIDGTVVHVSGIDHFYMDDAFCIGFEKYSKL